MTEENKGEWSEWQGAEGSRNIDAAGNPELVNLKLKVGIVGHGFVGGAVDYAFTHPEISKFYVDPKYDTTIDDLVDWEPHVTFICAPTSLAPTFVPKTWIP